MKDYIWPMCLLAAVASLCLTNFSIENNKTAADFSIRCEQLKIETLDAGTRRGWLNQEILKNLPPIPAPAPAATPKPEPTGTRL